MAILIGWPLQHCFVNYFATHISKLKPFVLYFVQKLCYISLTILCYIVEFQE